MDMNILHLTIETFNGDEAKLSFFEDDLSPKKKSTSSSQITIFELKQWIKSEYENLLNDQCSRIALNRERLRRIGKRLYDWLDKEDDFLTNKIKYEYNIVLAISVSKEISNFPWELLHDGEEFLIERNIVPIRWIKKSNDSSRKIIPGENIPKNRALKILFMASDPIDLAEEKRLNYETEEKEILEANKQRPLWLKVEDSGCLTIMRELLVENQEDTFDVFHLTGHGEIRNKTPYFITESEIGESQPSEAKDIKKVFRGKFPSLIFLSGCHSGQEEEEEKPISSLAESLIKLQAKAVLGWGHKTRDTQATKAAIIFYRELNDGQNIIDSLAFTYQELLDKNLGDWHLLRLYVGNTLSDKLVTVPHETPPNHQPSTRLWGKHREVATKSSFVGRRRHIQLGLKALLPSQTKCVGVIIHGFGGYGKSSLAARLCDRLSSRNYIPILWDLYDEKKLNEEDWINELDNIIRTEYFESEYLPSNDAINEITGIIKNKEQEPSLLIRLKRLFQILNTTPPYKKFLFIFDDFEQVLEFEEQFNDKVVEINREAKIVLTELIKAIQDTTLDHRIIITSRYDLPEKIIPKEFLDRQPIDKFSGADLDKKKNHLNLFKSGSEINPNWQKRAEKIADGNARLLEELDKIIQDEEYNKVILQALEKISSFYILAIFKGTETLSFLLLWVRLFWQEDFKSKVIKEELLKQVEKELKEVLSRGLIFEIPVPREVLKEVCQGVNNLDEHIDRAIRLGLISVTPTDKLLYVVRTFLPIDIDEDSIQNLATQGANKLHELWWNQEEWREEQAEEIFRLALIAELKHIALEVGDKLTKKFNGNRRFEKTIEFCEKILEYWKYHTAVNIYHNLAIAYSNYENSDEVGKNREKAEVLFDKARKMPVLNKVENKQARADLLVDRALLLSQRPKRDYDEIFKSLEESISFAQSIKDDSRIARAQSRLGRYTMYTTNNMRDDNPEKIKILEQVDEDINKSVEIFQKLDNFAEYAWSLHDLAIVKHNLKEYESAIDNILTSISMHKKNKQYIQFARNLNQLGKIYAELGQYFKGDDGTINKILQSISSHPSHQNDGEFICFSQKLTQLLNRLVQSKHPESENFNLKEFKEACIEEACRCFEEGIRLKKEYSVPPSSSQHQWAKVEEKKQNILKALELDLEALSHNQKFKTSDEKQNWKLIKRLLETWKKKNFYNQEEGCEKSANQLMEKLLEFCYKDKDNHHYEKAIALWGLGKITKREGDRNKALDYLEQSYDLLVEIDFNDAQEVKNCIDNLTEN